MENWRRSVETRREEGEFKNRREKEIVQVMKQKLRMVQRQTGDQKVGKKASKIQCMIANILYDG